MAWIWLIAASLCEIAWAVLLKASDGGRRMPLFVLASLLMLASFALLSQAMKTLPVGTAYAVWTGLGAVGASIIGIVWLSEPTSTSRLFFLGCVVVGAAGLSATSLPPNAPSAAPASSETRAPP